MSFACALVLSLAGTLAPIAPPSETQVDWQRSLADARALASAERRPMLVAVNMDGESASERIVRERYRDPAFVASTRPFVCVVSSVFRHTPRDHDDEGRRIECPRLGAVTCGEHVALEPALYDAFLGGERIAPRHAVIGVDGTKRFDLFLLFDLGELDRAIADAARTTAGPRAARAPSADDLDALAGAREHRARLAFEERVRAASGAGDALAMLDLVAARGNEGSVEPLRILLARATRSPEVARRWAETARALAIAPAAASVVRERLQSLGRHPGASGLGEDAPLLPLLADLDAAAPATRSLLLGYLVAGGEDDRRAASSALASVVDDDAAARVARAVDDAGGACDVRALLASIESALAPRALARKPAPRPAEELEREMEELDRAISRNPDDAEAQARYGRAALELAESRIESGGSGAQLLLEDADRWLASAAARRPDDVAPRLERARAAYRLSRFADEETIALDALAVAERARARAPTGDATDGATDGAADGAADAAAGAAASREARRQEIEAHRWVGDAAGRLLAARSGGDPAAEAAGIARAVRHLGLVAASELADETDAQSLVSIFGALGMRREELAAAQACALRLPESTALRQALNDALWLGGRIDLAPAKAEWIADRRPESAASAWFAGYAHLLAAEDLRREEEPDRAIAAYDAADRRLARSAEMRAEYKDSADHYRALAALGRGFAHLLADRRQRAAGELVAAVAIRPAILGARDGLGRDAYDLLDGALEWRASGPSPVAPLELSAALEKADPANAATWARMVADGELREALRADGRGTEKVAREVTRDGRTAVVEVPIPTAEGDAYMRLSVLAARRAVERSAAPENRRALAQSATVFAERLLERGEVAEARKLLAEAAPLIERKPPPDDGGLETLRQVAAELRADLGEARPVFRPGR